MSSRPLDSTLLLRTLAEWAGAAPSSGPQSRELTGPPSPARARPAVPRPSTAAGPTFITSAFLIAGQVWLAWWPHTVVSLTLVVAAGGCVVHVSPHHSAHPHTHTFGTSHHYRPLLKALSRAAHLVTIQHTLSSRMLCCGRPRDAELHWPEKRQPEPAGKSPKHKTRVAWIWAGSGAAGCAGEQRAVSCCVKLPPPPGKTSITCQNNKYVVTN